MPTRSNISSSERFRQILAVLKKNKIAGGITPEKMLNIIEELGPTFVKLGQLMSMRPDMLPLEYCNELKKLRTDVSPMPISEVYEVIESELGRPVGDIFLNFDETPVGSASIAQVHQATLKQGGAEVVVKVQRKNIYGIMKEDVAILSRLSGLVKIIGKTGEVLDFSKILGELWKAAQEELDFCREEKNIEEFTRNNAGCKYIIAPRVYEKYTERGVLVMEHIGGVAINELSALKSEGYDMREITGKLADNYLKQIMEDGFFHADPHSGNIKICDGKIAWIDFGMMGRLTDRDRKLIIDLLEGMIHGDVGKVKDVVLTLCDTDSSVNHAKLYSDLDTIIARYSTQSLGGINMEKAFLDVMRVSKANNLSIPSNITLLGRGLATLEGLMADICPEVNMLELIFEYMSRTLLSRFDWKGEAATGLYSLTESAKRALTLPSLMASVLKSAMKGQLKTNTEFSVSSDTKRTLDRLVTKIAAAFIVSALLIGSGITASADINPKVWGLPVISVCGIGLAVLFIALLIIDYCLHRK